MAVSVQDRDPRGGTVNIERAGGHGEDQGLAARRIVGRGDPEVMSVGWPRETPDHLVMRVPRVSRRGNELKCGPRRVIDDIVVEQGIRGPQEDRIDVVGTQRLVWSAENGVDGSGGHCRIRIERHRDSVAADPEDIARGPLNLDVVVCIGVDMIEVQAHHVAEVAGRLRRHREPYHWHQARSDGG